MLAGCRVLDLTGELGWLAGRLLADLGAEVVKVEASAAAADALAWQAYNVNKRLLVLDLAGATAQGTLRHLLERTDILLESAVAGSVAARALDREQVAAAHPHLVHVSVTAFGHDGPHAAWLASDLEIMAAGGAMSLAGEPGGKPLRVTVPQARAWAGTQAAAGALVALLHRQATGQGQHVDVSAQAAVLTALAHAPTFVDLNDKTPTRCGAFITGRTITGARFRAFWECRDGYVNFVLYGGNAGRRSNEQLVAWMRTAGADVGPLGAIDFARFDIKRLTQGEVDALEAPVAAFLRTLTKREFLDGASAREMLGYPVSTMRDIAADPQLEARGFWDDVESRNGDALRHCGAFAMVDGSRAKIRHAAGTPVALDALLREWTPRRDARTSEALVEMAL